MQARTRAHHAPPFTASSIHVVKCFKFLFIKYFHFSLLLDCALIIAPRCVRVCVRVSFVYLDSARPPHSHTCWHRIFIFSLSSLTYAVHTLSYPTPRHVSITQACARARFAIWESGIFDVCCYRRCRRFVCPNFSSRFYFLFFFFFISLDSTRIYLPHLIKYSVQN